jgi:zinc/manganese transport system permease protein
VGVAGYALGLALSAVFDLPSGAVIVWTLAATALLFALSPLGRGAVRPAASPAR